jgi:hypothetical protein
LQPGAGYLVMQIKFGFDASSSGEQDVQSTLHVHKGI